MDAYDRARAKEIAKRKKEDAEWEQQRKKDLAEREQHERERVLRINWLRVRDDAAVRIAVTSIEAIAVSRATTLAEMLYPGGKALVARQQRKKVK